VRQAKNHCILRLGISCDFLRFDFGFILEQPIKDVNSLVYATWYKSTE
jgi:hypothetical protein